MSEFTLHPQLDKDCEEVLDWPLCKLLLMNNAQVLWLILVPRVEAVEELHQLTSLQQHQLLQEVEMICSYLSQTFAPHKLKRNPIIYPPAKTEIIVLQDAIPVNNKIAAPIKIATVDVSPTEPEI